MELGQRICPGEDPFCPECPLKNKCFAFNKNLQERIPEKKSLKKTEKRTLLLLLIHRNRILLEKKEKGRFSGLWRIPGIDFKEKEKFQDHIRKYTQGKYKKQGVLSSRTHFYTKYAEKLHPTIYSIEAPRKQSGSTKVWVDLEKVENYPVPSVYRLILKDLDGFPLFGVRSQITKT